MIQKTEFSLQLDEATLPDNQALLMAYVKFMNSGVTHEEMLFAKTLKTETKGETIFNMVTSYMGKAVPGIFTIHCIVHRQHLVAKNLSGNLHTSLNIVIKVINKIKSRSLNDRMFRELCHENGEEFERLLHHTEVRWLSKRNCLKRVSELFDTIVEFLEELDMYLSIKFKAIEQDTFYLTDIFEKLNKVNLQLQGTKTNLIQCKSVIMSLIDKLSLYKQNLSRREFTQSPTLKKKQIALLMIPC